MEVHLCFAYWIEISVQKCMIIFSETAGPGVLSGFESLGNAKADWYIISVLPVIYWLVKSFVTFYVL